VLSAAVGEGRGYFPDFPVALPLLPSARAGCREGRFLPPSRSSAALRSGAQQMMQRPQRRLRFGDGSGDSAGGFSTAGLWEIRKVKII